MWSALGRLGVIEVRLETNGMSIRKNQRRDTKRKWVGMKFCLLSDNLGV